MATPNRPQHPKITPTLWYTHDLFGAVDFYLSVFPDSELIEKGERDTGVRTAEMILAGQRILAFEAERADFGFTDASSFTVHCADQQEVDSYWDRLLDGGGEPQQCGWLIDRYGLRWQVIPDRLFELVADPDPAVVNAVNAAMLTMIKLDVDGLEAAARSV